MRRRAVLGRLVDLLSDGGQQALLQVTPLVMQSLLTIVVLVEKQQALAAGKEAGPDSLLQALVLVLDEASEILGVEL